MAYPNKKCTFANRVVRRSKSQNISALALSLNRYHKSATPPFYSDIQSDTRFLIILVKDVHHKGDAYAAGLTYGYVWVLGDHWNIEATAGVGVLRYRQFKYDKGIPKPDAVNDSKTTIAPVKLGVSFVYIIR